MSFRVRLLISFSLLIALTFGAGGALLISTSFQSMLNEEKAAAIASYETTHNNLQMLRFFGEHGDYSNMTAMLSQMEEQKTARWQAISFTAANEVIYQSGNASLLPEMLPVDGENQYAYTVISDDIGRRLQLYGCLSLEEEALYLKASFDLSAAYDLRDAQQKMFWIIYGAVILLGMLVAGILSYALTRRLQSLTETVQEIASGELSRRSNIKSKDEFGQLSRDFDIMADRLEENIHQLEDDVRKKEEFMGAVAHELKTPMTSIIGYADLLRQCALNENDQISAANYIFKEGKRLEKLAFKLLDLLMMEKDITTMRKVDLETFLKDVVQGLMPRAKEKQVKLYWKAEPGCVYLEPDLVKSLIYNLVDNAIKSMGTVEDNKGDSIIESVRDKKEIDTNAQDIKSNNIKPDDIKKVDRNNVSDNLSMQKKKSHFVESQNYISDKRIMIKGRILPGGLELQIVDNGCGMEQEELSRITEAFYRVDKSRSRAQGGAGLGLTLCKKIVDLHHGTMLFRSVKGSGSWVTVELYGSKEEK